MEPKAFEIYRHFKGNLYQIITLADDSETGDKLVIYQGLYAPYKVYARPLAMFLEKLDKKKYPMATQDFRFERATDIVKTETTEVKIETPAVPAKETMSCENTSKKNADINPYLLEFLEADNPEQKLEVLSRIKACLTPQILTSMELSQGMEPQETLSDEQRYRNLKNDIITKQKYERPHR
ncbi:MAG: DUF1653 domain-containing protein [Lachnospiraceae bacterium]